MGCYLLADGAAREAVTGSQPRPRQAQEWLILLIDNKAAAELVKAVTDLTSILNFVLLPEYGANLS